MESHKDLFKKYIKEHSTKQQKPFAGLTQDLKHTYKVKSATGNDMLELLHGLVAGADSDNLDGLKTRLVRLDKMTEFLLKSDLTGDEQKTIYKAHTKVQTAIRKRKDEYEKKHQLLKNMIGNVGSGALQFLDALGNELPQLKIALTLGKFVYRNVKKVQDERKLKLSERQQQLKKDAELYYSRELLRGSNTSAGKTGGKNKLKRDRSKKTPAGAFADIESSIVNDNLAEYYGTESRSKKGVGKQKTAGAKSTEAIILTGIASDVKIIANYFKGQLIRDKDKRMDDLESLREGSRLKLQKNNGGLGQSKQEKQSSWLGDVFDYAMKSVFGVGLGGLLIKGLKKAPGLIKAIPSVIKATPSIIKSIPNVIVGAVSKLESVLRPDVIANMPGKAFDWLKSLPGKGMTAAANWWAGTPAKSNLKFNSKTNRWQDASGKFVKAPAGASVATEAVEQAAAKTGTAMAATKGISKAAAIPILGPLIAGGIDIANRRERGEGWLRSLAGGTVTGVSAGLGEIGGTALGAFGGPIGAFAGGAAGSIGGAELGSRGFDSAIDVLGALNPFAVKEANASSLSPTEMKKKELIKDALSNQIKKDPATMPSALVPIAKLNRPGDLKDILNGDSNGLGFLFSLKGVDMDYLLTTLMTGSKLGGGSAGSEYSSDSPNSGGLSKVMSGAMSGSGVSNVAAMAGNMRGNIGPRPTGPKPGGPDIAPGETEVDQFMQAIGLTETGNDGRALDDPSRFIRTKGGADSSAYGPYQITKTLAEGALKNKDWVKDDPELAKWMQEKFIPQGRKMLKSSYSDPTYGAGGQGDLNTEYDRAMYMKMSKALMAGTLKDAGGNPLEAAADWRFGENSNVRDLAAQDPRYYNEVSKSIEKQKNSLADQSNKTTAQKTPSAKPVENLIGQKSELTPEQQEIVNQERNLGVGKEEQDYTVDPDTGEKFYYDKEFKDSKTTNLKVSNEAAPMTPARQTVSENSSKIAARQNAPMTPVNGPTIVNNNNSQNATPASGSDGGSGTRRWSPSFGSSADLTND